MSERSTESAQFCRVARAAAQASIDTPPHERAFYIAALINHMRECATCESKRVPGRPAEMCTRPDATSCCSLAERCSKEGYCITEEVKDLMTTPPGEATP